MTQHDTPEAVGAMADVLDNVRLQGLEDLCLDAATMLRRLHQRAVDAEVRFEAAVRIGSSMLKTVGERIERSEAALATARADALREAVNIADAVSHRASHNRMRAVEDCHTSEIHHQEGRWHAANDIGEDIAILATKEKPHDQ